MSKRAKPVLNIPVLKNLDEVDCMLAEIAGLKRHVTLIDTSLNESIDVLKLKAAAEREPIAQEIALREQSLIRFAEYNKPEIFKKKKSLELTFGTFGFRQTSKLATIGKNTFARLLEELQNRKLNQYIRIKHEVDKEAMKGASPELLKTLNCKVQTEDEFFYEISEQEPPL